MSRSRERQLQEKLAMKLAMKKTNKRVHITISFCRVSAFVQFDNVTKESTIVVQWNILVVFTSHVSRLRTLFLVKYQWN